MRHHSFESETHLLIDQSLTDEIRNNRGEVGVDLNVSIVNFCAQQTEFSSALSQAFVDDQVVICMKGKQFCQCYFDAENR